MLNIALYEYINLSRHYFKPIVSVILVMVITLGCDKNSEKLAPEEENFARCYADVMVVHAEYEIMTDSLQKSAYNKTDSLELVFKLHDSSKQKFMKDFQSFKQDEARWQLILKQALKILEDKRREL